MTTFESHNNLSCEPTDQAAPVFEADPPRSIRRVLRKVLNRALAIPSQVDAFLLDFYPEVYQQTSTSMDREGKLNLLLAYVPEAQLVRTLTQEYPQEMLQATAQPELSAGEILEDKRIKYTIILSATISELDVHKVQALINHLRKYTADSELTVEQVRSGSVIVTCSGSERGFHKLHADFVTGQLATIIGFKVKAVARDSDFYPRVLLPGRAVPAEDLPILTMASRQAPSCGGASDIGDQLPHQPQAAGHDPIVNRLGGDPQEDTVRIARPSRRTRSQVWWSLSAAAGVAIVALVGDANLRSLSRPASSPSYLPSVPAPIDPALEPAPPLPKSVLSSPSVLVEPAPELSEPGPALKPHPALKMMPKYQRSKSPPAARARPVGPHKSIEGTVVDLHCQGAVSCRTSAARSTARECLNRFALDTTAGSLALSRLGDQYTVDYYHGTAPDLNSRAFVKCWQAEFSKLFGVEKSRWPSAVQIDWMPGERK